MRSRAEIKANARAAMGIQRGTSILLSFIYSVMVLGVSFASGILDGIVELIFGIGIIYWFVYAVGFIIIYFISYVMLVDMIGEYRKLYKHKQANVDALFSKFPVNTMRKFGGMLWMNFLLFIWLLFLVIPAVFLIMLSADELLTIALLGIAVLLISIPITIKYCSYFFTANVLADCPNVKATDAVFISKRITHGHKMDVFVFNLSWIGWMLLSILTCGILYIVYVAPYYWTSDSGLYIEMRNEALKEGRITLAEIGKKERLQ